MSLCILFAHNMAHAQLFLEQGKIEEDVNPGDTLMDSLRIHNTSDQTYRVSVYWEDFEYQPPFDGSKKFLPKGTLDRSLTKWINFSPQEFTLKPYENKEVSYVINVPNSISGGYYGVMFFEKEPEELKSQRGLSIVARVGCLFFIEANIRTKKVSLKNLSISGNSITGKIFNEGDVIVIPETVYYILDEDSLVADRGEVKNVYLPPDNSADYQIDLPSDLPRGHYMMVLTMDLSDGDILVKEIDFEKSGLTGLQILEIRD